MPLLCAVALVSVAAFGGSCPESIDWSATREFAPGMQCHHLTLDEPRLMENYMVRVDLHTPGLRVTGTGRAVDWGEPMADVTNRVVLIDTLRRRTRDFLEEHRAHGTNMVLAVNTSPWNPWEPPFTHRNARLPHLTVLNGEVVSHTTKRGPMLVVFTNNVAIVTNALDYGNTRYIWPMQVSLKDCIVYGSRADGEMYVDLDNRVETSLLIDHCLVRGGEWDEDPKFVDPTEGDYHLEEDSPALGIGYTYPGNMISTFRNSRINAFSH